MVKHGAARCQKQSCMDSPQRAMYTAQTRSYTVHICLPFVFVWKSSRVIVCPVALQQHSEFTARSRPTQRECFISVLSNAQTSHLVLTVSSQQGPQS